MTLSARFGIGIVLPGRRLNARGLAAVAVRAINAAARMSRHRPSGYEPRMRAETEGRVLLGTAERRARRFTHRE